MCQSIEEYDQLLKRLLENRPKIVASIPNKIDLCLEKEKLIEVEEAEVNMNNEISDAKIILVENSNPDESHIEDILYPNPEPSVLKDGADRLHDLGNNLNSSDDSGFCISGPEEADVTCVNLLDLDEKKTWHVRSSENLPLMNTTKTESSNVVM